MDSLHDIHGLVKVADYDELKLMMTELEASVKGPQPETVESQTQAPDDEDYMAHLKDLKVD